MKVNKVIKVSKKRDKLKRTKELLLSCHHQLQELRLLFIILSYYIEQLEKKNPNS